MTKQFWAEPSGFEPSADGNWVVQVRVGPRLEYVLQSNEQMVSLVLQYRPDWSRNQAEALLLERRLRAGYCFHPDYGLS